MRKLNSFVALLVYVLMIEHTLFGSLIKFHVFYEEMARGAVVAIAVLLGLHVILSLALFAVSIPVKHPERRTGREKSYARLNASTLIRRFSGLAMLVFIALHIGYVMVPLAADYSYASVISPFWTMIIEVGLVLVMYAHMVLSVRPLFVGLGFPLPNVAARIIQVIVVIIGLLALVSSVVFVVTLP